MKKFLLVTAAAAAMVAAAAPAAAETDTRHYAGTGTINLGFPIGNVNISGGINNPGPVLGLFLDLGVENSTTIGTRYTAEANAPSDTVNARTQIDVVFSLTGKVNKDCSFYSGNDSSALNIDFGVIGVKTGNNENVNQAFEMVGDAVADIETLTAGCNFNNEVIIAKSNGILGLVNQTPSGFDTDEFQNNIPYRVTARWDGVTFGSQNAGQTETLVAPTNQPGATRQQGAWRSQMNINITAPAINDKGLVAGNYTGSTTLTLKAL